MAATAECNQGLLVWEAEGPLHEGLLLGLPYVQGHKVNVKSWGDSLWVQDNMNPLRILLSLDQGICTAQIIKRGIYIYIKL